MPAIAELVNGRGAIRANDGHSANWLVLAPAQSSRRTSQPTRLRAIVRRYEKDPLRDSALQLLNDLARFRRHDVERVHAGQEPGADHVNALGQKRVAWPKETANTSGD